MRLTLPCYPVCQPAKILLSRVSRVRVRVRVRVSVKGFFARHGPCGCPNAETVTLTLSVTITLALTLTLETLDNKI